MSDTSSTSEWPEYAESKISFSSELAPREGEERLSETDAAELLRRRFGIAPRTYGTGQRILQAINPIGGGWAETNEPGNDLMIRLARMIPASHRTESVLLNVDLRPILSEITRGAKAAVRNPSALWYVNDVPVKADEIMQAGPLLRQETERIALQAELVATSKEEAGEFEGAADPSVARQAWIDNAVNGWRSTLRAGEGKLESTPELIGKTYDQEDPVEQKAAQEQIGTVDPYDQLLIEAGLLEGAGTPYAWLAEEDVRQMFGMDMVDWGAILENEANKRVAIESGATGVPDYLQVDTGGLIGGGPVEMTVELPSGAKVQRTGVGKTRMRLVDVFTALYSSDRTPDEVQNLQDKLIAGGYLDEDDVLYWGRGHDEATKSAWQRLVRDSISLGKDLATVLKDSTLAKRDEDEENAKKFQRDLVLTSSVGIASTADMLGQQVLGRSLSGEDHARLIEFIHQLETKQHQTLDPEGGQTAEAIDVEAEVDRWINQEHGAEAGAYDMLEQFNVFNRIARTSG